MTWTDPEEGAEEVVTEEVTAAPIAAEDEGAGVILSDLVATAGSLRQEVGMATTAATEDAPAVDYANFFANHKVRAPFARVR